MTKISQILLLFLVIGSPVLAQLNCIQDYQYRVPVEIYNSSATEESGLVEIKFDATTLISENKMQTTCADIRFLDQNSKYLRHWLDEDNAKTDNQSVWVELNSFPAGTTTIYMFYGNLSAISASDDDIFDGSFDDFSNGSLSSTMWSVCNGSASINDGQLVLANNTVVKSANQYTRNYTIQAYVNGITGTSSIGSIGQCDITNVGYGLSHNKATGKFELNEFGDNSSFPTISDNHGYATSSLTGKWRFTWTVSDSVIAAGPGMFAPQMKVGDLNESTPATTNIFFSLEGTGSMTLDWIMIEDNTGTNFSSTLGTEETIGYSPTVELSSNAPICSNISTELVLNATLIDGATYYWYNNDGTLIYSGLNYNAYNFGVAAPGDEGTYRVSIDVGSSSCATKVAELFVQVDAPIETGSISADTTVCAASNSGQIVVSDYTSEIERWQIMEGTDGMWEDRLLEEDVLPFSGLTSTHSFRALVSSGVCGSDYTETTTVWVDSTSNAGTLSEDAVVCEGTIDELVLSDYVGDIVWQQSSDAVSWDTIKYISGASYQYELYDSTWFRTLVTSGVCPTVKSNTVLISVNPPTVGGQIENGKIVCAGSTDKDTLFLTGYTGEVQQWEYSPTADGPWTVQTSTDNYFIYQGLQNDSYYRVKVESPGCTAGYSKKDTVLVESVPEGGTLLGSTALCADANEGYLELTDYTGKVVEWQHSYDGSSWSGRSGNYDTLNYKNLTDSIIKFRALVNTEHEVCSPSAISTIATITVSEPTDAGNLYPDTTTACIGSSVDTLKLFNYTGTINRWESSSTGGAPWTTINSSDNTLILSSLLSSTYFRVAVQSGACKEQLTENTLVQIDQVSAGGLISGATEVCEAVNSGKLSLFSYNGDIVKWESYTNGPDWATVPNSSVKEISYLNLTDTITYRAIVKSGVCPNDTSTTAQITVNPLPDVTFTVDAVNLNTASAFKNTSTIPGGIIQTWHWDFGDEESSASKNPSHTYAAEGTYKVKLSATSNKGCLDSISHDAVVFGLPDVSFTYENVCLFKSMFFTNTSTSTAGTIYLWNFGDGTSLQQSTDANHLYTESGTYTVTLKAVTSSGGVDSVSKTVLVYPRAVPNFSTDNICESNTANFTNYTESETPYLTYLWDFGNNETDQRTDPETVYSEAGNYPVKLRVETSDGCADSITKNILVFPNPEADFEVENVPYQQPSVFINQSSIDYGQLHYHWNFGDENTSDTTHPVYVYESPGVYTVQLTATSDSGCTDLVEKAVKIYDLPVVKFTATNVCLGDSTTFTNESTIPSGTLSFEWDFADGDESEVESPYHLYAAPGIYNVRLISISNNGARDTLWKDVTVYDLPDVDYTFNEACFGYTTAFENKSAVSDGEIAGVLWDFNDGTNSVQLNPEKDFLNPGVYNVSLEVQASSGCSNSMSQEVIVHHNPVADFSVNAVCLNFSSKFLNTSSIDNSDRPYTLIYNWNFDDGQVSEALEPNHRYKNSGGYQVQLVVTSDAGCSDTLYRLATVYPLPTADAGADTTVEMGFEINLQASGGTLYEWTPTDGLSDALVADPEARPMETTTYILRVTDDNGCINYDTMTVIVEDAMRIIPSNILTPNNNGENDTWNIVNIDAYPEAEITIFDRWGKLIYETTEYNNDWQGVNFNGDILPDGTYYYVILLNKEYGVVYKGAITILRDK